MPRSKEDYQWYKENGICVQCGSNKAETSRVRCSECLAKNAESALKRRKKQTHIKYNRQGYMANLRQSRKDKGLCIWCGKPQSQYSTCFCIDCRIKNQRKNEQRKSGIDRSERHLYGLCYRCGKEVKSGKLCEDCRQQSINNLLDKNESWYQINKRENKLIFG